MKNRRAFAGFTLIEVMVTIAILGILASLAIPAYDDYITRGQVLDALAIAQGAKLTVQERVALGQQCINPAKNGPYGEFIFENGAGARYVLDVAIEQVEATPSFSGCKVRITFKNTGAAPPLPKTVLYGAQIRLSYMLNSASAPSQTTGYWVCQAQDPSYAKFIPSSCTAS